MSTEMSRSEFPFEKARNTLCTYGHKLVEIAQTISAEKRMTHVLNLAPGRVQLPSALNQHDHEFIEIYLGDTPFLQHKDAVSSAHI